MKGRRNSGRGGMAVESMPSEGGGGIKATVRSRGSRRYRCPRRGGGCSAASYTNGLHENPHEMEIDTFIWPAWIKRINLGV